MKTGVLLINLGTPDSPSTTDVRKYLFEFLNDPRVIDLPWLKRKLLVNLIIVPFRAPKSAKIYELLWTDKGSPLLYHGISVKEKLQAKLGDNYVVELGMRYQNPSLKSSLNKLRLQGVERIIAIPMFPQYASSSSGSTIEKIMEIVKTWPAIPEISITGQFFNHPYFIEAFAERGKQYNIEEYDHVLFSFHGLPERQLNEVHLSGNCQTNRCVEEVNENNYFCYRAASYETARLLAHKLNIPKNKYTVGFQSRLGKDPWLKPYSDHVVEEKAKAGIKKLLVFSPAFIADCLETTVEIGIEYEEEFKAAGGAKLQLVESLNDHPKWIEALEDMVRKAAQ